MIKIVLSPGQEVELLEALENMPPGEVKPMPSDIDRLDQYYRQRISELEEKIKVEVADKYSIDLSEPEQPVVSFKENSIITVDKYPNTVWKLMEGKWYELVGNKVGDNIKFAPGTMGRLSHKKIKRDE
jgi:hypothetical protein